MRAPETEPAKALTLVGALILLALAAAVGFLGGAATVGLRALLDEVSFAQAQQRVLGDPLMLGALQTLAFFVAAAVGAQVTHRDRPLREALDLRPAPTALLALSLTAGFALQFPLHELAIGLAELRPTWAPSLEEQRAMQRMLTIDSPLEGLGVALGVALLPALSEELFFRGLLLPGLSRRYGLWLGIGLSSLLFGAVHLSPLAVAYATIAGLILAALRLRTGSILPGIALHMAFNLAPVVLPASLIRIRGFNTVSERIEHLPIGLLISASVVALLALGALSWLAKLEDPGDDEREDGERR